MLEIQNLIEINKNFSSGEVVNFVINDSILKINNSKNELEKLAVLLKDLLSLEVFKDANKETAAVLILSTMEQRNLPINQDRVLQLILTISRNKIIDVRRIKRLLQEAF